MSWRWYQFRLRRWWMRWAETVQRPENRIITHTFSGQEAYLQELEVNCYITQAEAVKQLSSGSTPRVVEVHTQFLEALDVLGLSWLTRLWNTARTLGTVNLEWQTNVVVPLFKIVVQKVWSNYRGITCLSLPRKVYTKVLERRVHLFSDSRGTVQFSSRLRDTTPAQH